MFVGKLNASEGIDDLLCLKEFPLDSLTIYATGTRHALPEPILSVDFCLARVSVSIEELQTVHITWSNDS